MKIILSLACLAALSYGYSSDTFYAKANDDGKLVSLTTQYQLARDDNKSEKYEPSFACISERVVTISKNTSSYESDRYTRGLHYFRCKKGLFSSENSSCYNPFFSISSPILTRRTDNGSVEPLGIIIAPVSMAIGAIVGSVFYEKKFDKDKYNAFIDTYGLERNKKDIFSDLDHTYTTKFIACDLSAYEAKDYTSITPETACKHLPDEGLFLYRTNQGMFSDGKSEVIGLYGADEISNPLKISQKIVQRMIEHYMDVVALHPEIPLPKTLPQLVLEKSQFEKESDFQKRKNQALSQREEEQKALNEAYISAVKKRNLAIFEELEDRKATVKKKIVEFRKQAFMAVATPPNFAFKNYDAENEKLYGEFSFGDTAYRVVSMNVDPKTAQKVHDKTVALTPQANYEMVESGDSATFKTKELLLVAGSDKLKFDYTDNRYQPASMMVVIPSYDISAFQDGIADATKDAATISSTALKALQDLERYRVKSQLAIRDTAIHHVNAKAPPWYENIECGDGKCAVGRGKTQEEALKVALAQLGCVLKSSVRSELLIEKTVTNDIEQKKSNYTIQESCSNIVDDGSVSITNTTEMDGWYYVRTVQVKVQGEKQRAWDKTQNQISPTSTLSIPSINGTLSDTTAIAFEWKPIEDPSVSGYYVYRSDDQASTFKRIATIENGYVTHFVDENLAPNMQYLYKFSSKGKNETESKASESLICWTLPLLNTTRISSTTAPVAFFQGISNMPKSAKVLWRPHSSKSINGYIIERMTQHEQQWVEVATVKGRLSAEYIDGDLQDEEVYYYRIRATNYDNVITAPSEASRIITQAREKTELVSAP